VLARFRQSPHHPLPQHDPAASIEADGMERILADIDATS
jgi:hypothetical protein